MQKEICFLNKNGLKISGALEEPNPSKEHIVIAIHGHASSKNGRSVTDITKELTKRGINSLRIDLDGCGNSEGKFEDQTITSAIDDIISAINFVKFAGYSKIDLFGSSFGGLAVIATSLFYKEVNRIGLKAPVSDYPNQRLKKCGQKHIDDWKERGYTDYETPKGTKFRINYSLYTDTQKYIMYDLVKSIHCPVLIIHGVEDESVDINDSRKLIENIEGGRLIEIPGGDHSLSINGDNSKSNIIFADWFEKGSTE
jgi:uncharacterized protein